MTLCVLGLGKTERDIHDIMIVLCIVFQAFGNNMAVKQKDTTIRELQKKLVRAHSTTTCTHIHIASYIQERERERVYHMFRFIYGNLLG